MSEHKRQRRAFIEEIVGLPKDGDDLCQQSENLTSGLAMLLQTYLAKEKACTKAIKDVQEKYDEIIDGAETQAEQLIEDANTKAAVILANAQDQKDAWEVEKNKLASIQQFQPKVKLDVGGVKYTTSLTTLRRFPDTMIGAMFSGRHALPLDEEGYHFIDRDGTHFRIILNFLRAPEAYIADLAGSSLKELKNECDYYGILDLMFPLAPIPPFITSTNYFNQQLTVSQGEDAIYRTEDSPLAMCPFCHSAQHICDGKMVCLRDFKATVEKNSGILSPNQPEIYGMCHSCYRSTFSVNL